MIWLVWILVLLLCCFLGFLALAKTSSEPDPYDYAETVDRSAELRHQIDLTC